MAIIQIANNSRTTCGSFFQKSVEAITFCNRAGNIIQFASTLRQKGSLLCIQYPATKYHVVQRDSFPIAEKVGSTVIKGQLDATGFRGLDHIPLVHRITDL